MSFPASPTVNQEHTINGVSWVWTGATWDLLETISADTVGETARAFIRQWDGNVAVGGTAIASATGGNNVAVGALAGRVSGHPAPTTDNALTSGESNVFIGHQAGLRSPTQRNNTVAVGRLASVDGDGAVALGQGADARHAHSVAIGADTATTAANQVNVGARGIVANPAGQTAIQASTTDSGTEWKKVFTAFAPNTANGQKVQFAVGKANADNQVGEFTFAQDATNSSMNMGIWGRPYLIRAFYNGDVFITSGDPNHGWINLGVNAAGNVSVRTSLAVDGVDVMTRMTRVPIVTTGASVVLEPAHAGALIVIDSALTRTVTIPTHAQAPFPVGTFIHVRRRNELVTISGAGGVTVESVEGGEPAIHPRYGMATLFKEQENVWSVSGALTQ